MIECLKDVEVGMQIVYKLHSACHVIDMDVFVTVMPIIDTDNGNVITTN
jgi:tRNA G26 N,N-dimethylase Trm1